LEQLNDVDAIVARHQANGHFYEQNLSSIAGITVLDRPPHRKSAYWTYALLAERCSDLMRKLGECGIVCQRLHLRNDIYSCFQPPAGYLPGVDYFFERTLSIPCGWWVSDADRQYVVDVIASGW
jgi:dTDP-4-amino-4,6-dideoxygalactose transaminase